MAESVTSMIAGLGGGVSPASPPTASSWDGAAQSGEGPLVLVPAGFIADVVGGLSGTIGELTGGFFGNAKLGKDIGEAASPLIKLLPFQSIPPQLRASEAALGPRAARRRRSSSFPPDSSAASSAASAASYSAAASTSGSAAAAQRSTIGSTVGGVLGGILPFQVVPPGLMPASAGPESQAPRAAGGVPPASSATC